MKKALLIIVLTSFSFGGFIAGQQYKLMSMLANGVISMAEHKAIMAKEVTKAKVKTRTRTKAVARLKRTLVAVPVIGIGIASYFEKKDFDEWQKDNPGGTLKEYTCEVSAISAEYLDQVLQDLPQNLSENIPDKVLSNMAPKCQLKT
jgi:hypothetical protein